MKEKEEQPELRVYRRRYTNQKSPFEKAGLLSSLFFGWLNPIINIATKVDFKQDMHYNLRSEDVSANCSAKLEQQFEKIYPSSQLKPGTPTPVSGLLLAIWRTFSLPLTIGMGGQVVLISTEFLNTYLVYLSIQEVSSINYEEGFEENLPSFYKIGLLMGAFILLRIGASIFYTNLAFRLALVGMKLRNALNIMIYKKMMKKSLDRDTTFDMGDLTNLTQVDAHSFANLGFNMASVISIPLKITFGVIALYYMMGAAMLPALAVLGLVALINAAITSLFEKYKSGYMKISDIRGKLVNEIFKNVRFIKIVGLENYFLQKLNKIRNEELSWVRKQFYRHVAGNITSTLGPALFLIVLYTSRIILTGSLKLSEAFVAGMVYGIFNSSIRNIGYFLVMVLDCIVSGRRICFFLLSEEVDTNFILHDKNLAEGERGTQFSITIKDGNFYWTDIVTKRLYQEEKERLGKKKKNKEGMNHARNNPYFSPAIRDSRSMTDSMLPRSSSLDMSLLKEDLDFAIGLDGEYELVLQDINLRIPKGACVAIVGQVGSGKSTLLSALIGELYHQEGTMVNMIGEVAYVSQKPWITSSTVKDAILFGEPYDDVRFKECIRCADMTEDLKQMSNGLDTVLGDRGVNLSGGQRTRLAIARAFYANKDIYLFDDPISALDVHVGKTVMEEGILHYLKGKTRLVSTHALAYLPYFDYIIIMDQGRIAERGTYNEILHSAIFQEIKKTTTEEPQTPQKKQKKFMRGGTSEVSSSGTEFEMGEDGESTPIERSRRGTTMLGGKTPREPANSKEKYMNRKKYQSLEIKQLLGTKTANDKVIDHIISSEDKSKGDVITKALFKKYVMFAGGYGVILFYLSGKLKMM
jgi:ABC-type multidrug transport system fused ATPase/permease subunit